jgi:hypothetical protein
MRSRPIAGDGEDAAYSMGTAERRDPGGRVVFLEISSWVLLIISLISRTLISFFKMSSATMASEHQCKSINCLS